KEIGGSGGWHMIEVLSAQFPRPERSMPPYEGSAQFWPLSWSPDGHAIAGVTANLDGSLDSVVVYSLAANRYERVETSASRIWKVPIWLADSHRLLVRDAGGISLCDLSTKRSRPLISVGGYGIGLSLGVTRDNRWITYTETATEGDIWVADLK